MQDLRKKDFSVTAKWKNRLSLNMIMMCFRDQHLSVAVVREPAGSKALLPSDVPNQEVCVADGYLLNVAANGGRRVDGLLGQTAGVGASTKERVKNMM